MALAKEVAASLKPGVLKNQRVLCVAAVMWVPYLSVTVIDRGIAPVVDNAFVLESVYKFFCAMLIMRSVFFRKTRILTLKNFLSIIFFRLHCLTIRIQRRHFNSIFESATTDVIIGTPLTNSTAAVVTVTPRND